jgi:hypothetical protein
MGRKSRQKRLRRLHPPASSEDAALMDSAERRSNIFTELEDEIRTFKEAAIAAGFPDCVVMILDRRDSYAARIIREMLESGAVFLNPEDDGMAMTVLPWQEVRGNFSPNHQRVWDAVGDQFIRVAFFSEGRTMAGTIPVEPGPYNIALLTQDEASRKAGTPIPQEFIDLASRGGLNR